MSSLTILNPSNPESIIKGLPNILLPTGCPNFFITSTYLSNDFSTFEKGMATTTDKARMVTSQGNTWMRAFTGLGGTMYSHGMRGIGDWTSMIGSQGDDMEFGSVGMELEENMRDMVEAILDSSDDNKDIVKKKGNKEISDKVELDYLVSRIKELSPEE